MSYWDICIFSGSEKPVADNDEKPTGLCGALGNLVAAYGDDSSDGEEEGGAEEKSGRGRFSQNVTKPRTGRGLYYCNDLKLSQTF